VKVTAQEEYGLRCLLQIAREPAGFLTVGEIARREGLTTPYVGKLMRVLRRAGFVTSYRGQKGGYMLARGPQEINVGALLAAIGNRLFPEDFCVCHAGSMEVCVHGTDCAIRSLWLFLDTVIERNLGKVKLQDLLCSERSMGSWLEVHLGEARGGGS
jgi:Rrf2 family protein